MTSTVPSRFVVGKREGRRAAPTTTPAAPTTTTAASRAWRAGEPHTFVSSLPLAMLALDAATAALAERCDARYGPRRHALTGREWRGPTLAHDALLRVKVPWRLLELEGAGDVLDRERHARNPAVAVGTTANTGQLHADVTVFAAAVAAVACAAARVDMGRRAPTDATPKDTHAPAAFPTGHALLLQSQPCLWDVPPPYGSQPGAPVCRVMARVEDAAAPTRFWIIAPVDSGALDAATPAWLEFCRGVVAAAVRAEPIDGIAGVLCPLLPGLLERSVLAGVSGLAHAVIPHAPLAAPATLDAVLSTYVCLDEAGAEPIAGLPVGGAATTHEGGSGGGGGASATAPEAEGEEWIAPDLRGEEGEGEKDGEGEARTDADEPETEAKPRILTFGADDDVFVALCDSRVRAPLLAAVVHNGTLRRLRFDGGLGSGSGKRGGPPAWADVRDRYDWVAWRRDLGVDTVS